MRLLPAAAAFCAPSLDKMSHNVRSAPSAAAPWTARAAPCRALASSSRQHHPRSSRGSSNSAPRRGRQAVAVWAGQQPLPAVNWERLNLQLAFIDRSDTVRARFAVGCFERVACWNGHSRSLVGTPCGIDAAPGTRTDMGIQAALFGLGGGFQVRPHLFTGARQQFEPDDIDRFDLLICLDSACQAAVLQQISADRPTSPGTYVNRICCLSDFLNYCSDDVLLQAGGDGLLDRQLRNQLRAALPALRPSASVVAAAAAAAAGGSGSGLPASSSSGAGWGGGEVSIPSYMLPTGIARPPLQAESRSGAGGSTGSSSSGSAEQWEHMALLMSLCCAGLVRYLLDCRPTNPSDDY